MHTYTARRGVTHPALYKRFREVNWGTKVPYLIHIRMYSMVEVELTVTIG